MRSRFSSLRSMQKLRGMWREDGEPDALYSDLLELDMSTVEPSLAGPKRPQDRIPLSKAAATYRGHLDTYTAGS